MSGKALSTEDEREILISQMEDVCHGSEPYQFIPPLLRWMRLLSARQLAVLLAEEANRHEQHVIREPPDYPG